MQIFALVALTILPVFTTEEKVTAIITQTRSCLTCGMIENVGQLDIKICGDSDCCFVQHLDNDEVNFQSGDQDRFEGPASLFECHNFEVEFCKFTFSILNNLSF